MVSINMQMLSHLLRFAEGKSISLALAVRVSYKTCDRVLDVQMEQYLGFWPNLTHPYSQL